tara:strand:+ start:180 stop:335 length:156 start_codon:yes stop_codon:yes gene_type:complete
MREYKVTVTIHNTFLIDADSEDEADEKVRELSPVELLEHCDLDIDYIEETS